MPEVFLLSGILFADTLIYFTIIPEPLEAFCLMFLGLPVQISFVAPFKSASRLSEA